MSENNKKNGGMIERNSYLISRAFRNYLWASLLSSACMQLTVMADAMVAGHFIGPDALTAINLAMPLIALVTALSTLIGLGPAIMAAKAIGSRDTEKVNSIFSSAVLQAVFIGGLQTILLLTFLPQVGSWLCTNEHLKPYLMDYIQVLPFTFFFLILAFTLVNLVEADGHPKLAMKAVALSSLFNVLLDVLFVKYLDFGIQGLALAMLSNYLAVTLFFILRMRRSGVSYRWIMPRKNILYVTKAGIKEGLPIMINDLLYSLMIFGVNSLLLAYCGETELYFWAVFLQLLLLVMVIVDCAEGAILSIGSVLLGENDWFGLRVLVRRVWLLVGGLAMLVVVLVWIFPGPIGKIFSDSDTVSHGWPQAVRILSLMLVPYALTTFMRSLFQLLGHKVGGVIFSVGQFILMATVLYAMIHWNPTYLWWSFPIASWMLFILQMMYMLRLRHKQRISALSIIPVTPRKNVLDLSVAYEEEAVLNTIHRICLFLEENEVDLLMQMEINICCEELMLNIVRYQTYKTRSYMDLSVSLMEDKVLFVLKDSGRPFNPVLAVRSPEMLIEEDTPLGLFLANSVCKELTHKYMYGLNVVFAEFRK